MKKDIIAGTFLDEVRKFKGPLKRVPQDYFEEKLIEEEIIGKMNKDEKIIFQMGMKKIDEIEDLIYLVCVKNDGVAKLFKDEHRETTWRRNATEKDQENLDCLRTEFKCIHSILMHTITLRLSQKCSKYNDDFMIAIRPGYKIVVGKLEKIDPLITQPFKDSTFSVPLYFLGTKIFN